MTNISQNKGKLQPLTTKELLYSVDSLALKIPLDLVEITHNTLNQRVADFNLDTYVLDELESYKKHSVKVKSNHYDVNFKINKHQIGYHHTDKKAIYTPTLSIAIHSKFLEQRYFEGITIENINNIYTMLMSLKVFKCDFKTFMNGYATDVDVKKDEYILMDIFKKSIKEMNRLTPARKGIHLGTNVFTGASNVGIQWNQREKSSVTYPFMKGYSKELELKTIHFNFLETFLFNREVKDIVRFEYSVKTRPIAKRFKVKWTTLSDLLNTPQVEFNRIHKEFVLQNFKDAVMSLKTSDKDENKLTPTQQTDIRFIEYLLNNGETIQLILNYVLETIENKYSRRDRKKALLKLYTDNVKGKKRFERAEDLERAFTFFGGGDADFLTEQFDKESGESDT